MVFAVSAIVAAVAYSFPMLIVGAPAFRPRRRRGAGGGAHVHRGDFAARAARAHGDHQPAVPGVRHLPGVGQQPAHRAGWRISSSTGCSSCIWPSRTGAGCWASACCQRCSIYLRCCSCRKVRAGTPCTDGFDAARRILARAHGEAFAERELAEVRASLAHDTRTSDASLRDLWAPQLRGVLFIGLVVGILQQITGINSVLGLRHHDFRARRRARCGVETPHSCRPR